MARNREQKAEKSTRRRRWRRWAVAALVLVVLLLALPVLALRTGWLTSYVLARAGEALGAEVSASSLKIGSDASIVAEGLQIRVPGVAGPAGELFEAERLEIAGSWGALLSGSGEFDELVLTRPRLRVSREKTTGAINLAELRVLTSSGGEVVVPPRVVVHEGVVEFGEHAADEFALLREFAIEGAAQPTEGTSGGYALAFREGTVSGDGGAGLGLTGLVTADGITLELDGLDLARWGPEHIPERFREVFGLLRIQGGIPKASLRMASDGSTTGVIELDGVSLNLPFDAEGRPASRDEMVRLRNVKGKIEFGGKSTTADLRGMLGDLPSTVKMRYDGLRADSPFRCVVETKGFALESNPEILPLAPGIVKRRLADFSNPTATVDAKVIVERGQRSDTGPGRIRVNGELAFRNGSAAFEGFPYSFGNMSGLARFDEAGIEIVSIEGVAPSGAKLHAAGTIIPPRSGAEVKIRVTINDVPLDEALLEAMGLQRRAVVRTLCHEESYERLREMDVVRAPGEQGPGRDFALGGVGSAVVDVYRAPGDDSDYEERIEVRFDTLGMVPEPFPLPIVARDVVIVIEGNQATFSGGSFVGLSGGRAGLVASVDLSKPGESGVELRIDAEGVPADELLLAALPGGLDREPDPRSPREVLERLGVQGTIDCTALIGPREDGELGYDIEVAIDGMSAFPRRASEAGGLPMALQDVVGGLNISERRLEIQLRSGVGARTPEGGVVGSGTLSVAANMAFGESAQPFEAEVEAGVHDVGVAIEDLVSVVAPELADRLLDLRAQRRPSGGIDVRVVAAGDAAVGGQLERLDVEVRECEGLRFDAEAGRFGVSGSEGVITLSALDIAEARFAGWSALIGLDGDPPSHVLVSGVAPVSRAWSAGDALTLGLRDMRVGSALVRTVASAMMPEGLRGRIESAQVAGRFDADLRVIGRSDRDTPVVTGEIRPHRVEMTIAGQRVTADEVVGAITLDDTGGAVETMRVVGDGWWADLRGRWDLAGSGGLIVEGTIDGESAHGLTPEVEALLPTELREALDALAFDVSGPIRADNIALRVSSSESGGPVHAASGRVVFASATAEVGVRVSEASGYLDFESQSEPGTGLSNFGIGIVLDEGQAAGVRFDNAAMRVTSDPISKSVLVPAIRANIHGGRLSGSAILHTEGAAAYEAEFRASGVPLGELLADWEYTAGIERAAEEETLVPERPDAEARGIVDAGLSLTGTLGDAASRRGRGRVLVGGGQGARVLRLPLLLPLIEVSNLQVPRNDPLDFGEAVFILDGDRMVFERLGVFAQSVEIFGYGQMWLPDLRLDLRFSSRATARLPVVSRILERLRDELIMTRVSGTVRDPRVSTQQFTRTRRMLAGVIGDDLTEEERRMLDIERQSRESERREWRAPRPSGSDESWGR
ncbi:MAG: hypothetical protein ACF8R9_09340 [Phycisphaerales bacterium JB054]